jgi:hypothetical protein
VNEDKPNVRRARRYEASKRKDELAFLGRFLAEPVGRRWFYDRFAACHIYSTSFSKTAMEMAFYEGERNVGLQLVAEVTAASPELYMLMLKEVEDERRTADITRTDSIGFTDSAADSPDDA